MNRVRKILFYGELPHHSLHGISIANQINLKLLESEFVIVMIEEASRLKEHDKFTSYKLIQFIRDSFKILSNSASQRFDYFYLVFSTSISGGIKSLTAIISFRLFNRGKVVLHIHRGDFFTRYYKTLINKVITKLVFSLSDKIIVLSENQKSEFEAFFKRPFYVLNNTVETEYAPIHKKSFNGNFIFISNYIVDKGISDLLEVFSEVSRTYKGITLKTFGEFTDKNLAEIIVKYESVSIIINGPISGINKYNMIANSNCLILPSWTEGQPVVLLEAMSVATPVIASAVGLIPELLGENYPFMTIPGDKESLKGKIIQFIECNNKTHIGELLYDRYKNFYTNEKHSSVLMTIFI
jgi:glycosyltransferase involved in cell wall biosynthesis